MTRIGLNRLYVVAYDLVTAEDRLGEKPTDFSYEHDRMVQKTLLKACGLPLKD